MMLLFRKCRRNLIHNVIKGNKSSCRLCGSVKDFTYCKNLLNKANEELHAMAEAVYGRSSTRLIITSVYCVGLVNGNKTVLEYSGP